MHLSETYSLPVLWLERNMWLEPMRRPMCDWKCNIPRNNMTTTEKFTALTLPPRDTNCVQSESFERFWTGSSTCQSLLFATGLFLRAASWASRASAEAMTLTIASWLAKGTLFHYLHADMNQWGHWTMTRSHTCLPSLRTHIVPKPWLRTPLVFFILDPRSPINLVYLVFLHPRSSILDSRFSILDPRFSILDSRFSILDSRFSILDSRFSILDSRSSILDPRFSILDSRSSILDSRSSILDSRFSILDSRSSILDSRFSILDPRFSILDPRSSILDSRFCTL